MKKGGIIFSAGIGQRAGTKDREPGSFDDPQQLYDLVLGLDVVLVDVRASPGPATADQVRYDGKRALYDGDHPWEGKPVKVRYGWWRSDLAPALGNRYRYAGHVLGGPGGGAPGPKPAGMDRLELMHKEGRRVMLLCACASPFACHRHNQIATAGTIWTPALPTPLDQRGIQVHHVFFDNGPAGEVMTTADLVAYQRRVARSRTRGASTTYTAKPLSDYAPPKRTR